MIEINETFAVAAPPSEVYEVLCDPHAVVECVQGAALGDTHEDGGIDGSLTVKFSAMKIVFKGTFHLELVPEERRGTLRAAGRDSQGGTKFNAVADFVIAPSDGDTASEVRTVGTIELAGKMAAMITGAASAVVRRMTAEFVEALARRCASGSAELRPAEGGAGSGFGGGAAAPSAQAVLLLHGFGGSPHTLRGWGEALAAAGATVSIPRLPGHGTTWRSLNRTTFDDWYAAAESALDSLLREHTAVHVMGISLGALLALRLAEQSNAVAGLVLVNPLLSEMIGTPRWLTLVSALRRSAPFRAPSDIKMPGQVDPGYDRIALKAAASLKAGAVEVVKDLAKVRQPVLLVTSADDHVVPVADAEHLISLLTNCTTRRVRYMESYHLVPLDYDAPSLFAESIRFVRNEASSPAAPLAFPGRDISGELYKASLTREA